MSRLTVDFDHEFTPNGDGVLPCVCGAYPILVEAEGSGGAYNGSMGYVCLNCPACMRPRRGRTEADGSWTPPEQVALEAWNDATTHEHERAGYFESHPKWNCRDSDEGAPGEYEKPRCIPAGERPRACEREAAL